MTPYQLRDGNYIHNLDTDDLIKRIGVMWAKLEKPGRVHMVQYTRVPFMTEYEYDQPQPQAPLQGCALPPIEAQLLRDIERARELWRMIVVADEPTRAPIVFLTTDTLASVNASMGVTLVPFDASELAVAA